MAEYFPDHHSSTKCFDDVNPTSPKFRCRGTAGTSIMWNDSIDAHIEILPDGSDRLLAATIETSYDPILLINTYMPTNGAANSEYAEILDEVSEVLAKYNHHIPIWTGDINASPTRANSTNDALFIQFSKEHNLCVTPFMPNVPTYYHFNGTSTSTIDLFIEQPRHF